MANEFVSQVLRVQGCGYIYQCMKKPFKTWSGTKIGAYFYQEGDLNYKSRFIDICQWNNKLVQLVQYWFSIDFLNIFSVPLKHLLYSKAIPLNDKHAIDKNIYFAYIL